MPQLVPELNWQSLTETINDIKSPNTFLQQLLFRASNTHPTESLEIGKWLGARKMVPFVKKGAEAFPIDGVTTSFRSVEAPNIRVKIAFNPSPLLFGRTPGSRVFLRGGESQVSEVQRHIALDMQYMADQITNRIEWMCAQALTGVIDYSELDDLEAEAFQFDYTRDAANDITLGAGSRWNESTADIAGDVREAKRLVSEGPGFNVTDVICGKDAANAFLNNDEVRSIIDRRRPEDDTPQRLGGDFRPDGAYFMGRIFGVDWWEYNRTVVDHGGTTHQLIGAKKAYFVAAAPGAGFSLEYGAIPDMDAFEGGLLEAERFSKSWVQPDPSVVFALTHSRPFPLMRYPEAVVEYTVLA